MSPATLTAAISMIERIIHETGQNQVRFTFHGGEPLSVSHALLEQCLLGIRNRFGYECNIGLQSNLWLLDEHFCGMFAEHQVHIGTSLDGPQAITDSQRGDGYFERTMEGIRRARTYGLSVGCIATFTPASARRWQEVFDFFLAERIGVSIHAALPCLGKRNPFVLSADDYGDLLCELLDAYVNHRRDIAISSLDQLCRAVVSGEGQVCTFRDCLGMFLAIDPYGDIYPCQRFCGSTKYRLGNVRTRPGLAELMESPIAQDMLAYQTMVQGACSDCRHLDYCRGGCLYNAWATPENNGAKDPYCNAYRKVYDKIQARLLEEIASDENIHAVAAKRWDRKENPLLRKGSLIELGREGPHPTQIARNARRIVAAVEMAKESNWATLANRLVTIGICRNLVSANVSLARLRRELEPRPGSLNNLYLHLTFRCQLHCSHCYACADAHGNKKDDMAIADLLRLLNQAKEVGFRQVVLTGGEPLIYSSWRILLNSLSGLKQQFGRMNIVLRTNLALPSSVGDLTSIAKSVHQVVVSIDGGEDTHNARRGEGTYRRTVENMRAYQDITDAMPDAAELSIACVLGAADIRGADGDAVRQLAKDLAVHRIRFRPMLPLGRAKNSVVPPSSEALGAHVNPIDLIKNGFRPIATCGMGYNLYVEPSGESFPCYAYHKTHSYLGNVFKQGLRAIIESDVFHDLGCHTVDTNPKCRSCDIRYLCGGACRAWSCKSAQYDIDAPPSNCEGLKQRALGLLQAAVNYLDV